MAVAEDSRPKTAFISHCGLFQYRVLPFGICNVPATFQRLIYETCKDGIHKSCAVYLDDIVVASPTFEQHLVDLRDVLTQMKSAGLSIKLLILTLSISQG